MNSSNIKLLRVDNRLVHGQVAVTWTATLSIHTIFVVDDEAAYSSLSQKIMETTAKSVNVKIKFFSVEKFVEYYKTKNIEDSVFVVVKNIQMARILIEEGIVCPKINIGNIHYERGRIAITKKVYATQEDVEDIQYMTSKGCDVFYQDVPGTMVEKLNHISWRK